MIFQNLVSFPVMVGQTLFHSNATINLFTINSTRFGSTGHFQVGKNNKSKRGQAM
jgi:hypothetical protein